MRLIVLVIVVELVMHLGVVFGAQNCMLAERIKFNLVQNLVGFLLLELRLVLLVVEHVQFDGYVRR